MPPLKKKSTHLTKSGVMSPERRRGRDISRVENRLTAKIEFEAIDAFVAELATLVAEKTDPDPDDEDFDIDEYTVQLTTNYRDGEVSHKAVMLLAPYGLSLPFIVKVDEFTRARSFATELNARGHHDEPHLQIGFRYMLSDEEKAKVSAAAIAEVNAKTVGDV